MYIIKNDYRNAYKTYDGWTRVIDGALVGLNDVMRFTTGEMELNKDKLPSGSRFVNFPQRRWRDIK